MPTQNMYSTGEVAKICGITIRTVQYYDNRELVVPSGISEGGRRLYSNDDLAKMKIVCFLRDLNIPIKTVSEILKEKNSKKVISLLLKEQKLILQNEINEKENKLKILNGLEECLEDSLSEDLIERVNKKVEEMENTKDKKSLQKISKRIRALEACIRSNGVWFDRDKDPLSAVRAYSNDMTVYIDSVGKKVRMIRAD